LTFNMKGIVWRISRQVSSLCPWARYLTVCSYLWVVRQGVTDGMPFWGQVVYP